VRPALALLSTSTPGSHVRRLAGSSPQENEGRSVSHQLGFPKADRRWEPWLRKIAAKRGAA